MSQTPAGWFPDPEQPGQQRYWDGSQWTEHRAPVTPAAPTSYEPPSYPDPSAHKPGEPPGGQATYGQPPYGQPPYGQQSAYGGYPPNAGFPGYAPTQSNTTRNVLIAIAVVFVVLVGGCFAVVGLAANRVDNAVDEATVTNVVTYRVTGTSPSATITYSDDDLSTTDEEVVSLPWEEEVTITSTFFSLYTLNVTGDDQGSVSCEILVNGESVDTDEGTEGFSFAYCSASD